MSSERDDGIATTLCTSQYVRQICKGLVYAGLALAILKFAASIVLVVKPSSPVKLGSAGLSFLMWPLYLGNDDGISQSSSPSYHDHAVFTY